MTTDASVTPVTARGPFTFDPQKAIQAILYIANRLERHDMYSVLKALYFADKHHLHRYGRFIFGDRYVAMRLGPVPSGAYDLIKIARGESPLLHCSEVHDAFTMDGYQIVPFVDADSEVFSDSDIECLNEAIRECDGVPFSKLKERSHDQAWESADENDFMTIESIAALTPDKESLLKYLQDPHPDSG